MLTNLNTPILILSAIAASFFVAVWFSLIIWTARDIKTRSRDPFLRVLSILAVLILNFIGFVVYLILRPRYTISELFQQTLEEEALLQALENTDRCPGCGKAVEKNWLYCPFCETDLKSVCQQCEHILRFEWNRCPICGTMVSANKETFTDDHTAIADTDDSIEDDAPIVEQTFSDELIEDDTIDQL